MHKRFTQLISSLSCRRPLVVVVTTLILATSGLALASRLRIDTSRIDLLSQDNPVIVNYDNFTREFGTANNIHFILESPSLDTSKRCADALAEEMLKHPTYIRDTLHKFDTDFVKSKFLLYLPPRNLQEISDYLNEESQMVERLIGAGNVNQVFDAIAELAEKRGSTGFNHQAASFELAALASLMESINTYLDEDGNGKIELLESVASKKLPFGTLNDPEGYLVGKDGRTVILLARPNAEREDSIEFLRPMMAALEEVRENVRRDFPDTVIGMTGLPTFAYGDLRVMENEVPTLSLAALALVITIFFLIFRHPGQIAFAGLSMLLAFACTLGVARLLIGRLNIISSVFGLMMIGLGIDFGVHLISRFNDEVFDAENVEAALKSAIRNSGPPITTGALTTTIAFLSLATTDFQGLAELGIIAGVGLLFCLLAMLVVLPAFISLTYKRHAPGKGQENASKLRLVRLLNPIATIADKYAGAIVTVGSIVTLLMCFFAPRVQFDYNFLHIQPETSKTAHYEEILMERTGMSPSFNAIIENDLEALRQTSEKLAALPSVSRIDSAAELIPPDQELRTQASEDIVSQIAEIKSGINRHSAALDLDTLIEQYEEMQAGLEMATNAKALIENKEIISQIARCSHAMEVFFNQYESLDRNFAAGRLQEFSIDLLAHINEQMAILSNPNQLERVTLEDFPESIRTRFVGKTGKFAAYVFPSQSIWNNAFLDRFNTDVTAIVPDATGTTLFAQTMLNVAAGALRQCSLLVFGAIVLLLFLHFRRFGPALLALLPVTVGLIWMLGIMEIMGWRYNPINIMAVPLTLGIGIDNGVHIVHRFRDAGRDIRAALLTSGRAVTVSSITTIAGFACLLFSTHRGLVSLGQLMALGVGACFIASIIVLPATLKLLDTLGIEI